MVAVAVTLLGFVLTAPAQAADIVLSPADIMLTVGSGESGSTLIGATLNNAPPSPFSITFQLRPSGGSLPPAWLTSQPAVVNNSKTSVPLPLAVTVPAAANAGTYTSILLPAVLAANYPLAPTLRPLIVTVVVSRAPACASAPEVSITSVAPADFGAPNNRVEDLVVKGTVTIPAGCTLERAWYELEDEYGLNGNSGEVSVAGDGSFTLSTPVTVSRRGDDRDGRTYRITVRALDEAGPAEGASRVVTIGHDRRGGK
jgi:hypothetical protein